MQATDGLGRSAPARVERRHYQAAGMNNESERENKKSKIKIKKNGEGVHKQTDRLASEGKHAHADRNDIRRAGWVRVRGRRIVDGGRCGWDWE